MAFESHCGRSRKVDRRLKSLSGNAVLGRTGYQPVPSGNLPDGTGGSSMDHPGAGFVGITHFHSARQVAERGGLVARTTHFPDML